MKTIDIPFGANDSDIMSFEYKIPDGYEGIIEDGVFKLKRKDSEDEKTRKMILDLVKKHSVNSDRCKMENWLSKQKEQKPAEWSEEEKRAIDRACVALRAYSNGDLPEFLPSELLDYADRLQSLSPQSHWKPSEEQMDALRKAAYEYGNTCLAPYSISNKELASLYEQLRKS